MKKEALFIAFSTQKGGVGKTTFTVLAASYLHYVKGYNVAVVDCDYPQHSIQQMRKRDGEMADTDMEYRRMAYTQFKQMGKTVYPIITASPDNAIEKVNEFLENDNREFDVIFFDLPGTVNSQGVLDSLSNMDYIFTPIISDLLVLQSSLSFVLSVHELLVIDPKFRLKGVYVFWNMVDGREKTDLYEIYEKSINEFGFPLLKTFVPDTKRYKKELSKEGKAVFRSTLFPADKKLLRGSNLEELLIEIAHIINL